MTCEKHKLTVLLNCVIYFIVFGQYSCLVQQVKESISIENVPSVVKWMDNQPLRKPML